MTWAVPETQMEPLGFRTRWAAASQARLNSWLASGPRDLSQSPLWTETILPAWQVMPPLERKYGGSAKTRSTEFSGMAARTSRQSPWYRRRWCLGSSKAMCFFRSLGAERSLAAMEPLDGMGIGLDTSMDTERSGSLIRRGSLIKG